MRKILLYCDFKTVVQLHRGDNLGQKYEFLEELGLFVFFFLFWEKTFRFEIFYLHSAHPGEQIHWKRLMKSRKKSTNFGKLIGNYFNWTSEKSSLRVQCNNFRGKASIFPKKTECLFLLTKKIFDWCYHNCIIRARRNLFLKRILDEQCFELVCF